MRALVTGGAGFIGTHLVNELLARGFEVIVLDLREALQASASTAGGLRMLRADVRDEGAVAEAIAGADLVFHLAARADLAGRSAADYDANLRGTETVCNAARRAGVSRFVFFSSMLAVGLTGSTAPIDESSELEAGSWYGRSKRMGEAIVSGGGLSYTILRPTLVYGPGERATMFAFMEAVYSKRFVLIGRDVLQSFAFVKNVVHAAIEAALHPKAAGGTYFVSDDRPYTLAEFARTAANELGVPLRRWRLPKPVALAGGYVFDLAGAALGRDLILSSRRVRTMTTHYVYSIEAARSSFGYEPPWKLQRSMRETAAEFLTAVGLRSTAK